MNNPYTEAKPGIHPIIDTMPNRAATIFWRIWAAYEEAYDEAIVNYERDILPQKIKEAVDKLHKQWEHALSKSNRRVKAIAARDKEWVAMLEKYFGDLPAPVAQFKKDMGVSQ